MSLHRFYGIKKYTHAAIKAHADGNPFNPNGCKGAVTMFYYDDGAKGSFTAPEMAFGTAIRSNSLPEYVYTVNSLLDKGAEVNADSAYALGVIFHCNYTLEVKEDDADPVEVVSEDAKEPQETDVLETVYDDEIETSPDLSEDPLPESEATEDDPTTPDWEYAESFALLDTKTEAKKALETYAQEYGVELSCKQKFEDMMKNFRVQMEA